jgi:hypothetical protein
MFYPLENLTLLPKKLLLLSFSIVLDSHRTLNESINQSINQSINNLCPCNSRSNHSLSQHVENSTHTLCMFLRSRTPKTNHQDAMFATTQRTTAIKSPPPHSTFSSLSLSLCKTPKDICAMNMSKSQLIPCTCSSTRVATKKMMRSAHVCS